MNDDFVEVYITLGFDYGNLQVGFVKIRKDLQGMIMENHLVLSPAYITNENGKGIELLGFGLIAPQLVKQKVEPTSIPDTVDPELFSDKRLKKKYGKK